MEKIFPPQPDPSIDTKPFWDSLKSDIFAIQKCVDCNKLQFPMIEKCRHCGGNLNMHKLSGKGTIYTFIIEHRAVAPGFDHLLPYAIALITPDEAPHVRIPARIVDTPNSDVKIGAKVEVQISKLDGGDYKIPVFKVVA